MSERSYAQVEVPQGILERFKKVATANVWDILLGHSGVYFSYIENVHLRTPGERLAARARTLRYLPPRPDLLAQVQAGADGPEYRAMARCGPGDVLVCDVMGDSRPCVFGDVKALQLRMNNADGIVTDGSIRDLGVMVQEEFGLIIYARDRTPRGGVPYAVPAQENVDVQCGGALVRPGDVLVGDDDVCGGCAVVVRGGVRRTDRRVRGCRDADQRTDPGRRGRTRPVLHAAGAGNFRPHRTGREVARTVSVATQAFDCTAGCCETSCSAAPGTAPPDTAQFCWPWSAVPTWLSTPAPHRGHVKRFACMKLRSEADVSRQRDRGRGLGNRIQRGGNILGIVSFSTIPARPFQVPLSQHSCPHRS